MHSQTGLLRKVRSNFGSLVEIFLFFRILILISLLPPMLRLLSFSRLMTVLTPRVSGPANGLDLGTSTDKIVKYTDYFISRSPWTGQNNCLKRSLVLFHFLRKSGIDVQLCLGVRYRVDPDRLPGDALEGHAWLLHNGNTFLEKRAAVTKTYRVTYCFPNGVHKTV
jgi:hypothetical protein